MNWSAKLGWALVTTGALLLSAFLLPTLYGEVASRIAVRRFHAHPPPHRRWDSSRLRAYQQALTLSFAPPEAILRVPRVGIEVPVYEGTSDLILNRGAGHIPGTALPGESGNLAIAGHRDGFFRGLKDIAPNDVIEVQRPRRAGDPPSAPHLTDRYIVRSIHVVLPADVSVLEPTTRSTLTLVTCYPFYFVGSAPKRYIVQAALVGPSATFPNAL